MRKLLKAAKRGNVLAQCVLGNLYFKGIGVPQDYFEALKWFEMSGKRGDPSAQFRLGLMYEGGYGVAPNRDEAVRWMQKAALLGHTAAQYYLEIMFAKQDESGDTAH